MTEIKPLLCRQCGSHDLRLEKGKYVCHYCGTVHFDAGARKLLGAGAAFLLRNRKMAAVSSAILALAVAAAASFLVRGPGTTTGSLRGTSGVPVEKAGSPVEAGKEAIEPEKKVRAEFTDITPLPDSIGNVYFVGMYRNTGETPVYPRAEIALYDAGGRKVAVARGYAIRGYLMPGEKIPISVLVQKAPAYKTVRSIGAPEAPSYYQPRPKLAFSKLKMSSPEHRYDSHRVSGMVKNISGEKARYVQMDVTVFDSSGRIVGHGTGFLGQTDLNKDEESPFDVDIRLMKGRPARFTVEYNASVYRGHD